MNYPKFANLVKKARTKLNLTQDEFAKILGKERVTVTNYEAGRINIPGDVILRIQELLYPEKYE